MNSSEIKPIPIIAHTAYSSDHIETKFNEIGFDDYLPKPFTLPKLK